MAPDCLLFIRCWCNEGRLGFVCLQRLKLLLLWSQEKNIYGTSAMENLDFEAEIILPPEKVLAKDIG